MVNDGAQMDSSDIVEAVDAAKEAFGVACGKYSGALTVEIIRHALTQQGIVVSARDVFIQGVPLEIDFLIPRRNAKVQDQLLYQPQDVLAIVEVKNAGSFGESTIQTVRKNFQTIKSANPHIKCCYLTLEERKNFKWAVNNDNSGGDCYTMFWHHGSGKNYQRDSTKDWERFVSDMKKLQAAKKQ